MGFCLVERIAGSMDAVIIAQFAVATLLPVAANIGVTSGICPFCDSSIPPGTPYEIVPPDRGGNVRIL